MSDETTDESNEEGKKLDKPVTKPKEPDKKSNEISPLDRAEAANKEKAVLLEREEKLQERKEKLFAEEKVGGRATISGEPMTPEEELQKKGEEGAKEIVDAFR